MSKPPAVIYTKIDQLPAAAEMVQAALVLVERAEKYKTIISDADASIVGELRARLKKHVSDLNNQRLEMTAPARAVEAGLNEEFKSVTGPMNEQLDRIDKVLKAYLDEQERKRKKAEQDARDEQQRIENERRRQEREAEEAAERERQRIAEEAQKAADNAADAAELEAAQLKAKEQLAALEQQTIADANQRNAEAVQAAQAVAVPLPAANRVVGAFGSTVGKKANWKWRIVDITKVPESFLVAPEERVQKSTLNALAKSQKEKASVPGVEFYSEDSIANFKVGS